VLLSTASAARTDAGELIAAKPTINKKELWIFIRYTPDVMLDCQVP
jgi:hypothetical protein